MNKGKFLVFFVMLMLLITSVVCADTLQVGSKGQEVSKLQRQLKSMGYYKGAISGYFGSGTKAAVKKFQLKKGFIATGKVDSTLNKAISNGTSSTQKSKTETATVSRSSKKQAQKSLKELGFYKGTVDGVFGPKSKLALKNYQKKNGLGVTGELNTATLKSLTTNNKKSVASKAKTDSASVAATKVKAAAQKVVVNNTVNAEANLMQKKENEVLAVIADVPQTISESGVNENKEAGLTEGTQVQEQQPTGTDEAPADSDNTENGGNGEVKSDKVEVLDWWTQARAVFKVGTVATVIDVQTGKSFKIVRTYGANHADCETLTKEDTAIMKEIWGGKWNWSRRPVLLEFDGRVLAASMAGMPHAGLEELPANKVVSSRSAGFGRGYNLDLVKDNGMDGHFDVHFLNSRTHGSNKVDPQHQAAIKIAAKAKVKDGVLIKE